MCPRPLQVPLDLAACVVKVLPMSLNLKEPERIKRLVLWAVLLLGLSLRLQQWGRFIVADEDTIFGWIRQLPGDPFPIHFYPPFFQYINYWLSLIYGPILSFLGVISFSGELWVSETGRTIVMAVGRLLSTLFGMLQVFWIYRIGKRFFTTTVGLLAALLAAVNPLLILDSHILKVDLLLAFLFTVQLYLILSYWEEKTTKKLCLLGLVTGLAIAAKFQAAVEIPALIFLVVASHWRRGIGSTIKTLLVSAAWLVLGFFAGAPNWAVRLVGNVKAAFAYVNELYFSFELYDKGSASYLLYLKDFIASFGPFVMLAVLGALLFLLLRFSWKDLLIWTTLASFVGILGYSGFYAHRMGLPLYAALSLLAAKFVVMDLLPRPGKSRNATRLHRTGWVLLAVGALAYTGWQSAYSVKRFNLWRTASTLDRAIEFRDRHFEPETVFVRENFSPVRPGDKGIWDLIGVESDIFHGPQAMPFVSSGLLADYLLSGNGDEDKRFELHYRLKEYLPFHKICKPRFSEWDGDVTFWYHTALAGMKLDSADKRILLPRAFALHRLRDTVAYPTGRYEKSPGLLKTGVDPDWRMIYSQREISGFRGMIFSPDKPTRVLVDVNGKQVVLPDCLGAVPFTLMGASHQKLHHDWVYRITADGSQTEVWLLFEPIFQDEDLNRRDTPVMFQEMPDINGDLSSAAYHDQEISFYKRTGLDVRLYTYLQRVYLQSAAQEQVVFLQRGTYRLRASARDDAPATSPLLELSSKVIGPDGISQRNWVLNSYQETVTLDIAADYAMTVWTVDAGVVKPRSVWIEPDLASYLNRSLRMAK